MQPMPVWARFQWINDEQIADLLERALPYAGTGRRGVGKATLFRWLLYKQCHSCTDRDLESMSGVDYSTFIKFRKTIKANGWLEYLFLTIVRATTQHRRLKLITDSSFVEQYARTPEAGAEYSGFKEETGFKVHQIIDFRSRLPVAKVVTGGARADVLLAHHLVAQLPREWQVRAFLADKGYDSSALVQQVRRKWRGVAVNIPVRRTNQATLKSRYQETPKNQRAKRAGRTLTKKLYNQRTEIERYFSRKKGAFHLGQERTRGLENFALNCTLTDVCAQLEFLAKPGLG